MQHWAVIYAPQKKRKTSAIIRETVFCGMAVQISQSRAAKARHEKMQRTSLSPPKEADEFVRQSRVSR